MDAKYGDNLRSVGDELKQYASRVEVLLEQKKAIQDEIKDIKDELKARGFCVRTFNDAIKIRALDENERREREELRDLYLAALELV